MCVAQDVAGRIGEVECDVLKLGSNGASDLASEVGAWMCGAYLMVCELVPCFVFCFGDAAGPTGCGSGAGSERHVRSPGSGRRGGDRPWLSSERCACHPVPRLP